MEHRIGLAEAAILERPTFQQVKEEMDKYLGLIKDLVKREDHKSTFNACDAQHHKPIKWFGRKDKVDFTEFSNAVKNWAEVLHGEGVVMMEEYETKAKPIEENEIDTKKFKDIDKFGKMLYNELVSSLTGEPLKFVINRKRGQGIQAWREIVNWYDCRSEVDKSSAYAKIVNPAKRATNLSQAIEYVNVWESLVSNYEVRHGRVDDVAKITGLEQILPESFLDTHVRGKRYEKYAVFRQESWITSLS